MTSSATHRSTASGSTAGRIAGSAASTGLSQAALNYAKTAEQIWLDAHPNYWQPSTTLDNQITHPGNQLNPWMMSFPVKGNPASDWAGGANPADAAAFTQHFEDMTSSESRGLLEFLFERSYRPDFTHRRTELGFALGQAHWGRGYASEAIRMAIAYAFDVLAFRRARHGALRGDRARAPAAAEAR